MKKYWKIILLVVVLVGGIGLYFGMKEYNRGAADVSDKKTDVVIKAADLTKSYSEDEVKSDSLYLNKTISVSGVVNAVQKDEKGAYSIVLTGDCEMNNVTCQMDERHNSEAENIAIGSSITVKGTCTGAQTMLAIEAVLIRCAVDK